MSSTETTTLAIEARAHRNHPGNAWTRLTPAMQTIARRMAQRELERESGTR